MNKLVAGFAVVAALVAGAAVPSGGAKAVGIINGSFELGVDPGPSFTPLIAGATNITGWTIDSGSIDYIGGYWTAQDGPGHRSVDMNGGSAGSISQTLNGLANNQQYKVSFWVAGNPDGLPTTKTLDVIAASIGSESYTFSTTGHSRTAMGWVEKYFFFTADGPSAVLTFASTQTGAYGMALDNISMAATPLPAALPLFGSVLGAFGLFGWFRRRLTATA